MCVYVYMTSYILGRGTMGVVVRMSEFFLDLPLPIPLKCKAGYAREQLYALSKALGKHWRHLESIFNYVCYLGVRVKVTIRISGVSFTWNALGTFSHLLKNC